MQVHFPSYPLREFVDYILYLNEPDPIHNMDRFLPDGNTELIIDMKEEPKFIYDNIKFTETQACRYSWISGVRTKSITIPSGKNSILMIVAFKKGMAQNFYPMPMSEISDHVVDSNLVFGESIRILREQLLSVKGVYQKFCLIEKFLYTSAGDRINQTIPQQCVQYAINFLQKNSGLDNIAVLSNQIGYSQKHLIDLFKKHVGVTPKIFHKILRFQKAILELEKTKDIDWIQVISKSGFYDQSHFINEFKLFSGFTPTEYLSKKSLLLNYIPVG